METSIWISHDTFLDSRWFKTEFEARFVFRFANHQRWGGQMMLTWVRMRNWRFDRTWASTWGTQSEKIGPKGGFSVIYISKKQLAFDIIWLHCSSLRSPLNGDLNGDIHWHPRGNHRLEGLQMLVSMTNRWSVNGRCSSYWFRTFCCGSTFFFGVKPATWLHSTYS